MSKGSSPNHRFSGTYDGYYDPEFTAEISHKMQVPDRISLLSDQDTLFKTKNLHNDYERLQMHVPDRILLSGEERHIEDRGMAPELRLESSLHGPPQLAIQLNNPPHNLTLDNHHYPAIEEEEPTKNDLRQKYSSNTNPSSSLSSHAPNLQFENGYSISPPTPPSNQPEDELTMLKRQVRSLSRRVIIIEQDNQQLHQREVVFCTGVVLYFLIKGLFWLNRNW